MTALIATIVGVLAVVTVFALAVIVELVRDHHAAVEADSREPVGGLRRGERRR